ncbi:MAG: hypothetical protein A2W51_00940 [Candidatus Zambryskibacteria bacterium RIFCSPHIGHO2_02_39_10]|nr:MAG: hypothetical protein A2W51_00940 [Candidatus Zambryskibacteria bacterium RIFCSPHIGHO2_02_39_10]
MTLSAPPPQLSGIMAKLLSVYAEWNTLIRHIPKIRRYSLGVKIDILFSDIIELVSLAQFSSKELRRETLQKAITKNDCLKFMLYVMLELKGIEEKHFFSLAPRMEEVGKLLYSWKMQNKPPQ